MEKLEAFRAAMGRLFGSAFFMTAALASMAIWVIILMLGVTGAQLADYGLPYALQFPIDVSEYQVHPLVPDDYNQNVIYGVQCFVMIVLVVAIWSYQYVKSSTDSTLSRIMVWTISCMFVVFYGFILPTFLFFLNCSQLTDERNGLIELHDIQLFVLDQFFRSVVFDVLEAMKISISGLDYADDSDLGFRFLVTIYRLSVPMWVFMVWRRVRAPKPAPKPTKAQAMKELAPPKAS